MSVGSGSTDESPSPRGRKRERDSESESSRSKHSGGYDGGDAAGPLQSSQLALDQALTSDGRPAKRKSHSKDKKRHKKEKHKSSKSKKEKKEKKENKHKKKHKHKSRHKKEDSDSEGSQVGLHDMGCKLAWHGQPFSQLQLYGAWHSLQQGYGRWFRNVNPCIPATYAFPAPMNSGTVQACKLICHIIIY